jgi:uncharacterized protein YabE (DUF348 family)
MKNLFSDLSSKKGKTIFIYLIVLVVALSILIYETTKKAVAMTIDGQEKIIYTHANTVQGILDDLDISLSSEDYVFPSVNTEVKYNLKVVYSSAKQVQLVIEDEKKTVRTAATTVSQLLQEQKIVVMEHDKVFPSSEAKIINNMEVKVLGAFPLTLNDGGKEQQVWSTSTTVADFLLQQEISLNQQDRIEPKPEDLVTENAVIKVIRVEKVTDVVEEPIKFAVVTQKDKSMAKGTQKVLRQGQNGLAQRQYEVIKENGQEVSRSLISEKVLKEKQDHLVAIGTLANTDIASRGDTVVKEFYVNSTAYTASCNGCSGTTATGINLRANPNVKVIAVDPRIIPLGTKVYVEGYGYAVAADTGSSIKGYKIDVFFAAKADAYRWGNRRVKIKILN